MERRALSHPTFPLHRQVQQDIERQIDSGGLRPGDWLPSESELQQMYGVSRTPVRHALGELERNGQIFRAQGRRSQVRGLKIAGRLRGIASFSQELEESGHVVEAHTLGVEIALADEEASHELRLSPSAEIIVIRRMYVVDGMPFAISQHRLAPAISIEKIRAAGDFTSLYELLGREGIEPWDATEMIGAVALSEEEAAMLATHAGAPALLMRRTSRGATGEPIELSTLRVRSDRYETRIELRRVT